MLDFALRLPAAFCERPPHFVRLRKTTISRLSLNPYAAG